jgi:hypothetical protein
MRRLTCIGEEGEPERRVRDTLQDRAGGLTGAHRVPASERLLTFAEVTLDAGEDDLDTSEEPGDGLGEAHSDADP